MYAAVTMPAPDAPAIVYDMAAASKKRGPATGYVRMTFDMRGEDRARLKVCAALASQAEGKTVTMGQLLERWTKAGMDALEKKLHRHK